jgi:hypothetical protein
VLFIIVSFNELPDWFVVLSPVVLELFVATHVNVEALLLVNAIPTEPPLQIVALPGLVIAGVGFTVTIKICGVPTHPSGLDVSVIV